MITLEDCNVCIQVAQADQSGLSTIEKIYYMARGLAVDIVEDNDGVWREKVLRDSPQYGYGHLVDAFDYYHAHLYSTFVNTKNGGFWTEAP